MIPNYNRSDFVFTGTSKVEYIGKDFCFERPKNLTKFDLAVILDVLQPRLHWCVIYNSFQKSYLILKLKVLL